MTFYILTHPMPMVVDFMVLKGITMHILTMKHLRNCCTIETVGLSYNNCEMVQDLYAGFETLIPSWAYGMNSDKQSSEVLILSKDYVKCR